MKCAYCGKTSVATIKGTSLCEAHRVVEQQKVERDRQMRYLRMAGGLALGVITGGAYWGQ